MRTASVSRKSSETEISIDLAIEGCGKYDIEIPVGFLTHMLEAFSKHGQFDLKIRATGDMQVDQHHTIEDLAYVLGSAFKKALGERRGIQRAGFFIYPMDDSLVQCAVDLSGRPYVIFDAKFAYQFCGQFDTSLTKHFFEAFARGCGANIAIRLLTGENDHHKLEAIFKAFAKSMRDACIIDPRISIPSTKGGFDL